MKAHDVMVSPVITVTPSTSVHEVAKILLERNISAVPVVDSHSKIVGIIGEGDLLHRAEAGTERSRPWWLRILAGDLILAADYIKERAQRAGDVMTRQVITATPGTPLREIAMLLEKHAIKRVPIVENEKLVGIVSRANLVQAVASTQMRLEASPADKRIRESILMHLRNQPWTHTGLLNVTVQDGVVDLWGMTYSDVERKAIRVAAETTPGVRTVNDHLSGWPVAALT
jgi:CBS domain-containing protein